MRSSFQGIHLPAWYGDWVLGHRVQVLIFIGLVTLAAGYAALQMPVQTSLVEAFVDDPGLLEQYRQRCLQLGGDSDDLVYVATEEGADLFSAKTLNAIRAAARQMEQLDEVERVSCLPDVPWAPKPKRLSWRQVASRAVARRRLAQGDVESLLKDLKVTPAWPVDERVQERIDPEKMKRALLADDRITRSLLGKDGETQIMVVKLVNNAGLKVQEQVRLTRTLERTLAEHGLGTHGVHVVGLIVSQGWMFGEITQAFFVLFPLGLLVICTTVWAMFRRLAVVAITAVIGLIAMVWGIGATGLIFGKLSVMVAAAPLVILVISTSDVVHLATAYKLELGRGTEREQALRTIVSEVGGACLVTSITTFVGFISLVAVPAPSLRHFAVAAAVGVAGALLLAITVVPITLSYIRPFPVERENRQGYVNRLMTWCVSICQYASLQHSRKVAAICLLIIVASLACATQIHVDADFPKRFPAGHPLRTAVEFFNQELAGTTIVDIFLEAADGDLLKPETLRSILALESQIREIPEVSDVYSLANLYRTADEIFFFGTDDGLPETQVACEACVQLLRELDKQQVGFLIDDSSHLTRLSIRLRPSGYLAVRKIADRIEGLTVKTLPPSLSVETSGSYPIVGDIVKEIVRSQLLGIAVCFVSITVIMAIGVGSLRVALWAQLPNMLPAVLVIGGLAISMSTVDTDMLGIPTVALGIAVDDTVHFLHRFRLQFGKSHDTRTALEQTFPYTGQAILKTTIILCVGLLPFSLSSFLSVWMLGTFLVFTLISAVLADLLLLPAMINLGLIKWRV